MRRTTALFWFAVITLVAYIAMAHGCIEPHYHLDIHLPARPPADAQTEYLETSLENLIHGQSTAAATHTVEN